MIFVLLALITIALTTGVFFYISLSPKKISSITDSAKIMKPVGFWRRQFQSEATFDQKTFDWIFGIMVPVICVVADPIVFNGSGALIGGYKPFAYLLSFVSIMMLMAFMLWGKQLKWLNGFLCGFFALGATISLLVGIVLFPFSLIGLIFIIGALGFTPLFSAFVYGRNAVRAYKYAQPLLNKDFLIQSAVLSALFGFVVPYVVNVKIERGLETIQSGDVQTIQRTTKRLRLFSPILNPDLIQREYYQRNSNQERKEALRKSYETLSKKSMSESSWD
jgi:hypothetical protein